MFYLSYIASELRRRKGRTFLTALGLAVGVGLVVTVSALSSGLDEAQDEVLKPLTGVGTDMSVARPLDIGDENGEQAGPGGFLSLSPSEREQLRKENGERRFGLQNLGKPGERFETDNFVTMTQLSFPERQSSDVSSLEGAKAVAAGLTLNAIHVSGRVPKESIREARVPGPGGGPPRDINLEASSVSGVDQSESSLGAITAGQVSRGRYFSADDSRQAILNIAYARRKDLSVGDTVTIKRKKFEVIGLASPPLGGQASDIYIKLSELQALSGREGRVNTLYVRADRSGQVAALSKEIEQRFQGSEVTTSQDLADRVGGSLVDAKDLTGKLGTALTIVGLVAAFLIASLLTLSSVTKRVRELGTLKALGWPQRLVVRQVTGEALAQGALGGLLGAAIGVAGGAIITALGPTLEATVAEVEQRGPPGFGQGAVTAGSKTVTLDAPVDAGLVLLAIGLALIGGLVAGAVGAARAARLRPADALRHID